MSAPTAANIVATATSSGGRLLPRERAADHAHADHGRPASTASACTTLHVAVLFATRPVVQDARQQEGQLLVHVHERLESRRRRRRRQQQQQQQQCQDDNHLGHASLKSVDSANHVNSSSSISSSNWLKQLGTRTHGTGGQRDRLHGHRFVVRLHRRQRSIPVLGSSAYARPTSALHNQQQQQQPHDVHAATLAHGVRLVASSSRSSSGGGTPALPTAAATAPVKRAVLHLCPYTFMSFAALLFLPFCILFDFL